MDSKIDYRVHTRENVYFYMRLLISLGLYYGIVQLVLMSLKATGPQVATIYVMYVYVIMIIIFLFFRFGLLIGHLKGNGIKVGKNQFADIHQVVVKQAELLGLSSVPSVYILQSGGVLNAFAARFLGRNYIVLYSEMVETAYDQDKSILEFIIGHEMGHIKRNHMLKGLILFPSYIIPFLGSAYSRACEYTCDNIGHALCPAGARGGLLVLASGKTIYKKVNLNEFLNQDYTEDGFWKWFAEKVASHPNLTRRLGAFGEEKVSPTARSRASLLEEVTIATAVVEVKEDDHNKYMPR
ncbi:MAG TPA: peptidase M48 [Prolixibacteraceae bacterium]|jgi:Zn-dependent protease with chaperone function|nr:peptidase M48 [Prolixibacteraceae bacterium]